MCLTERISQCVKRLLSGAILSSVALSSMAFVVKVTNIPEQLNGAPLFITSALDNRTLDSIRIEGSDATLTASLDQTEWCTLNYSYRIEYGGVRTYHLSFFNDADTVTVSIDNYDDGMATVSGSTLNNRFQSIQDSIYAITKNRPDNMRDMSRLKTKITDLVVAEVKANRSNPLGAYLLVYIAGTAGAKKWLGLYDELDPGVAAYPQLISVADRQKAKLRTDIGSMFTNIEGIGLDGKPVSLADYLGKGKYVLVDFWAYWCGPCRREAKETLMPLYEKYKDNPDFMILGVMTSDEPENHIREYKNFNYPWPQMVDTNRSAGKVFGFDAIPYLILFGPDGKIIVRGIRGSLIDKCVEEVLK